MNNKQIMGMGMYDHYLWGLTSTGSRALDVIVKGLEANYMHGTVHVGFTNFDVLCDIHTRIHAYKDYYLDEATEHELKSAKSNFVVLKRLALKVADLCTYDITDTLYDICNCSYSELEAA
jgi:hypothetical protein